MLFTADEARAAIVRSGARLLATFPAESDPFDVSTALWGAGAPATQQGRSARPVARHRKVIDELVAAGYDWVAVEELEGLSSASGLDEGQFDPGNVLMFAAGRRGS